MRESVLWVLREVGAMVRSAGYVLVMMKNQKLRSNGALGRRGDCVGCMDYF